jgi:hypothetical protein
MEFSRALPKTDRLTRVLSKISFGARSVPLALLVLCILAYGFFINRLGFYWDDWPWIWMSHIEGPAGMLQIDQAYRPLSGVILWLGSLLAGKSPLAWQILNLVFRWCTGLALWWSLRMIWPKHLERAVWIAFLFLVYPGFGQQFVSVNSSRHILPLVTFFLSIGFMVWAIREKQRYWLYTTVALLLSIISLLATDYYFGLELSRPVILWFVVRSDTTGGKESLKRTLLYWLPYLGVFALLIGWRYLSSLQSIYPVQITDQVSRQPVAAVINSVDSVIRHAYSSTLAAWSKVFDIPVRADIGLKCLFLFWLLVILSLIFSIFYLLKLKRDSTSTQIWNQAVILGVFSLLTAGLPFLAADIPMGLEFPNDRSTLPMMFGASLLFVGLIDLLARKREIKIFIIAFAVSLATGSHVLTAISYENDWNVQSSFLRQLTQRAPDLKPGTAIVYQYTPALQEVHFSDNSLTAILNWVYDPDFSGQELPYYLYDLRLRSDQVISNLADGIPFHSEYGAYLFSGSSEDVLVVQFAFPWCLQILQPQYMRLYPNLPYYLDRSVKYSNPGVIESGTNTPAGLPDEVFISDPDPNWCFYYQQADLARQQGDWHKVAEIGDLAFLLDDPPKQPTEYLPYIQGYGNVGRWDRAADLTLEAIREDEHSQPILCLVWADLEGNTLDTIEKERGIARVMEQMKCREGE